MNVKFLKDDITRKHFINWMTGSCLGISALPTAFSKPLAINKTKVVRIYLPGGMSHVDSWDPKPEKPDVMGNTKTIRGNTGEQISEYFPMMAKNMEKFSLVRSMKSPEGDHTRGMYLAQTSYPKLGTTTHPNFGSFVHALQGSLNPQLPMTVNMGGGEGSGYLSSQYDPLLVRSPVEPLKGLVMKDPQSPESQKFMKLTLDLQNEFHQRYKFKNVRDYAHLYNDAMRLLNSEELKVFDVKNDPDFKNPRYNFSMGTHAILTRKLLEHQVRCVNIRIGNWDHHSDLWDSFIPSTKRLDQFISVLLEDLHARGLLKSTIVTVMSEFGRTPVITKSMGRDHHNKSFTTMIAGAGVKNGIIVGETNDTASKVITKSHSPIDFNATVAKLMGIQLEKEIYSPDNRPFTITRGGIPIKELIA